MSHAQAPSVEEVKVLARFLRSAYGHCTEDAAAIASAFASLEVAKHAWQGGSGEEAAGSGPTDIGGALSAALSSHGVMARPAPRVEDEESEFEDDDEDDDDDYAALEREQLQFRQERKVSAAVAAAAVVATTAARGPTSRAPTQTASRQQVSIPKTVAGTTTAQDLLARHDEALARAEQALEREKHDNIVKMKARYMHGDDDEDEDDEEEDEPHTLHDEALARAEQALEREKHDNILKMKARYMHGDDDEDEEEEEEEEDEPQPVPTSRPNRAPEPHRRSFPHPREQSLPAIDDSALSGGSSSDPDALVALRMKLQQEEDNPNLASTSDKYPDLAANNVGEDVLLLARMLRSSGHDIPNAAAIAMAFAGLADTEEESSSDEEDEEDGRAHC